MTKLKPWPAFQLETTKKRYKLAKWALRESKWRQSAAARLLGCSMGQIRRLLESYPDLAEKVAEHNPGQGRR